MNEKEFVELIQSKIRNIIQKSMADFEEIRKTYEDEIQRLKEGNFTPEEFQNLCHNLQGKGREEFQIGCNEYQEKLFGKREFGKSEIMDIFYNLWGIASDYPSKYNKKHWCMLQQYLEKFQFKPMFCAPKDGTFILVKSPTAIVRWTGVDWENQYGTVMRFSDQTEWCYLPD